MICVSIQMVGYNNVEVCLKINNIKERKKNNLIEQPSDRAFRQIVIPWSVSCVTNYLCIQNHSIIRFDE